MPASLTCLPNLLKRSAFHFQSLRSTAFMRSSQGSFSFSGDNPRRRAHHVPESQRLRVGNDLVAVLRDVAGAGVRAHRRQADITQQLAEVGRLLAVVAGELDLAESRRVNLAQRAFEILFSFGLDRPQLDAERDLAVMVGHGDAAHQGSGRQASSRGHEKRTSAQHESAPLFVESRAHPRGGPGRRSTRHSRPRRQGSETYCTGSPILGQGRRTARRAESTPAGTRLSDGRAIPNQPGSA